MICTMGKSEDDCKGRIFGRWADCPHGWRGRLDELEQEAQELRALLEAASVRG